MLRIRGAFMYVCIPARTYARQTSLGITHVTLRYLVPYPQFLNYSQTTATFCSNTPEGSRVLSPPFSLSLSLFLSVFLRLFLFGHISYIYRRNEASYYCRYYCSAALRSLGRVPPPTCLSAPLFGVDEHRKVDNRRWRGRSTLPDLSVASLDCFAAPCVSREIRECRDTERERERERERRIRRVRRELESVSLHFTTLSRRYRDPSSFRFRDRFGEIRGLSSICVKMAR